MGIQSEDFLALAQDVMAWEAWGNHEAGHRTVIGRAYYAGFLYFRTYVDLLRNVAPDSSRRGGLHDQLLSSVTSMVVPANHTERDHLMALKAAAYLLVQAKKRRHLADYALDETLSMQDARDSLEDAEAVLTKLASLGKPRVVTV